MVAMEINVIFHFNNTNSSSAGREKRPTTNMDTQTLATENVMF